MSDDPAFLALGTEVSAKFKGAYCEAKIKKVDRSLKVKVALKEAPFGSIIVPDTDLPNAKFEINEVTDVLLQRKLIRCAIQSIKDQSKYHVVFNDGDEKELRRTQLVLKGGKHFDADGNLDSMPLTNPESFSTPVVRGAAKRGAQKIKSMHEASGSRGSRVDEDDDDEEEEEVKQEFDEEIERKREKRRAANAAVAAIGELRDSEESGMDSGEEQSKPRKKEELEEEEDEVEEKPGPSNPRNDSSDEDEDREEDDNAPGTSKGRSPLVNGTSAQRDEKSREKLKKRQEKEERRRLRAEEREREKEQREKEKRERNLKLNQLKERSKDVRRREKLFRRAALHAAEQYKKSNKYIPTHRSKQYYHKMKLDKKRRKKWKNGYEKYRLRNAKLHQRWRRLSQVINMNRLVSTVRNWRRTSTKNINRMMRSQKLLETAKRLKLVTQWLEGAEKMKRVQFVVLHESYSQARRLLKFIERASEKKSFTERCNISFDEIDSLTVRAHFSNQEWYVAVLFPNVFTDPNGGECKQRTVRNLATGELVQVWEDDLIPFHWMPHFKTFEKDEVKEISARRPKERRFQFKLSWKFASYYIRNNLELDLSMIRSRLRWNHKKSSQYLKIDDSTGRQTSAPSPTKRNEENDDPMQEVRDSDESDYDSDDSIKNANEMTKSNFLVTLIQFHDARNSALASNPMIQGVDVDLYYFHELARRMGGPKKILAANPWTEFGRKLVPSVESPEDELKYIFKTYLEPFLQINSKLTWQMESLAPRSERKAVQPGQYSERRKRKTEVTEGTPKTSNHGAVSKRGGRGGSKPGRKRKSSIAESLAGRVQRKSSSPSGSRQSTGSPEPGPSNAPIASDDSDEEMDDDDARSSLFSGDSDRRGSIVGKPGRKKKKETRTRRSMSIRREEPPPSTSSAPQPPKKGRPRKNALPAAAPIQKNDGRIKRRRNSETKYTRANLVSLISTGQKLKAFYNKRWYEAIAIEDSSNLTAKLMDIMLKDQDNYPGSIGLSVQTSAELKELLKKMRTMTHYNGWNKRYDEYLNYTKLKVTIDDQAAARRRFRDLPRASELRAETLALVEALVIDEYAEESVDELHRTVLYTPEDYLKLARAALDQSPTPSPVKSVPRAKRSRLVESDEDGEESEEDDESDEKDEESGREEEVRENGRRRVSEVKSDTEERRAPSEEPERSPSPEPAVAPGTEEGGLESESDEPEYPPAPTSPELAAMRPPPIVQNIPSVDRTSSTNSSFPILSRQVSSTSISSTGPIFPPTSSLAHSGPLTLDDVPIPSTPSTVQKTMETTDDRKRSQSSDADEVPGPSPVKRMRRISEVDSRRSLDETTKSPKRMAPFVQQYSSGALTLDIPPTETSGPIEPLSIKKAGRKMTVIAASPSFISSGPLTLSPTTIKSPIGRPKKKFSEPPTSAIITSIRRTVEEEDVVDSESLAASISSRKESQDSRTATSGSTTPMTIDERDDESRSLEQFDRPLESHVTPRGAIGRGGKRKRGGGRFGGSYPTKPPKSGRKAKEDEPEETEEVDTSQVITPSGRADSFQSQKNRMAKLMEQEGTREMFHLLDDLPDFNSLIEAAPIEDINMLLEERTNELRDLYANCKAEFSQLERRFRQQNEAKRKAASAASASSSNQ